MTPLTRTPVVSIVMPTYNGARYIDQAIQSCLDQTYPHWELVIVDDAGSDDTPAHIARFAEKDSRIRSVRHKVNRKLPGALNTGILHMRGDYFTWLSDDDLFRPNALEEMVTFLETHPDIDLVYTDYTEIDEEEKPIRKISVGIPEDLGIHNPTGVCHLERREVFDTIGLFDEQFFLAEDLDFWIRALIHCKMQAYHIDLFLYRQHARSLTQSYKGRVYPVHARILERHLPNMYWMTDDLKAYAYLRLAKRAFQVFKLRDTVSFLFKALSYSPRFVFTKSFKKSTEILSDETARDG
jgi:glycosyltransferase involved in cell wall biosynthesis